MSAAARKAKPSRAHATRCLPSTQVTPVGAVARGAVAGVVGTLAMDLWLYGQYRRGHGTEPFAEWEFSSDVTDWDKAPAPAQVGRRIIDGLFEVELPDSRAALTNNVMHWGYSVSAAVVYAMVAASLRKTSSRLRADLRGRAVGLQLRHPATDAPLQAHHRVRRQDARQGSARAPRLRNGHGGRLLIAAVPRRRPPVTIR